MPIPLIEAISPSPYGDPEAALIEGENPTPERPTDPWSSEVAALVACMRPIDQLMLDQWSSGMTQVDMAAHWGASQPTIWHRIRAIERWIAWCLPRRVFFRQELSPPPGLAAPDADLWRMVVAEHQTLTDVGHYLGCPPPTARRKVIRVLDMATGYHEHVAIMVKRNIPRWTRARCPQFRVDPALLDIPKIKS